MENLMYQSIRAVRAWSMTMLTIVGSLSLMSTDARAQTQADAVVQHPTISEILGTRTDVSVGVGAEIDQRYMGARDFRFEVLPTFDINRGIFFADSVRGAGMQYQSASGFYASLAFNYDFGRTDQNTFFRPGSDKLRGMGDVKGTVTSTITISQPINPWLSVNAEAEFALDAHKRGNQYLFGFQSNVLRTEADTITVDLQAKLGDAQYNQTYFGVTPLQNANSGFNRYTPGWGIYAYSLSAIWTHFFDKHWSTELMLGGTRYTNKAADSPVVQQKTGITVFTSVGYAF
jgi:outer membrane protein